MMQLDSSASPQNDSHMFRKPKKSLGQNFLIDPNYKRKIIESLQIEEGDKILEIGPGRGFLTDGLIEKCKHLWIIEKDRNLASELSERYQPKSNVTILTDDFLKMNLSFLKSSHDKIKVVGNLPYNIASQIFIRLIENRNYFSDLFLMFQKEMALRFVAKPGTKDYGLLTLWATIYTDCQILFHLPPTVFRPRPKVSSSFVHFKIKEKPLLDDNEAPFFWKVMRKLFQHRRKTIHSTLKNVRATGPKGSPPGRSPLHVGKTTRAETLSVKELIELARVLI